MSIGGVFLNILMSPMITTKVQVTLFWGRRQENTCLLHKKYSPGGMHGAPRKQVLFIVLGAPRGNNFSL